MASKWTPPTGYIPIQSSLEGVTVYAPQKEDEKTDTLTVFKCPKCGATTRFDVAAGGVACEHCGYLKPVEAAAIGRKAEEYEFTLETLNEAEQGWGVMRQALHCDSCGVDLSIEKTALTITCPFCASNKVNVRVAQSSHLRPRYLVPFKILAETNRARAREWLGKGWFHPDALAPSAILDHFSGVYMPFWTFDAQISAAWKAEVGHEHQERYYDSGSKSWKTRIVIRWRWQSGRVNLTIDDLLVSGSAHASRLILEKLFPFNLNELVTYHPDFLAGWQAHSYEITLPAAWEDGKAAMRQKAVKACYADIGSSHVRNFSMTADFADQSWRYILLPVYISAYKYENKVFQVMVNGQTGVVAGQKPVAWWKIWLAIAALLSPGAMLGLIGFPLLIAGGIGFIPLALGFILFVVGGIFSFIIYQQAVASEAA